MCPGKSRVQVQPALELVDGYGVGEGEADSLPPRAVVTAARWGRGHRVTITVARVAPPERTVIGIRLGLREGGQSLVVLEGREGNPL